MKRVFKKLLIVAKKTSEHSKLGTVLKSECDEFAHVKCPIIFSLEPDGKRPVKFFLYDATFTGSLIIRVHQTLI